jgi:hypothetical protein
VALSNTVYSSFNGVLFNKAKTTLIKFPGGISGSYSIPNTVTNIERQAFYGCKITNVTIPDCVISIGDFAFSGSPLSSIVNIPDSVIRIGAGAFSDCDFSGVTIPKSVTIIGNFAFSLNLRLIAITVDLSNSAYCSLDGVLFDKAVTTLMQYPLNKEDGNYIIPSSVKTIKSWAFNHCQKLQSVIVSDGVLTIEKEAFLYTTLTNVVISSSVVIIEDSFGMNTKLKAITVDSLNPAYSTLDGVLFNKTRTTLIQFPNGKAETIYSIPGTVTNICRRAFYYTHNQISIIIPPSVVAIGERGSLRGQSYKI